MTTLTQRTFSSGEVSPSLYARVDLVKYATGLRTCKNCIILRYGGASNRPGTSFIGEASDSTKEIRLIPFIFNVTQTYILELGHNYMRVIKNGSYIKLPYRGITGASQTNPVVITSTAHLFTNGDEIAIRDTIGMTQINGRNFKVQNVAANTYELYAMDGVTTIDGTGYSAYVLSGFAEEIYEIATNYTSDQVNDLKYVQSADVVTIAHQEHPPAEISRVSDSSWSITDIDFSPKMNQPLGPLGVAIGGAGTVPHRYTVTAVNENSEESLPFKGNFLGITNITQSTTPLVTAGFTHGYKNGDRIEFDSIVGMTELNDKQFAVTVVNATQYTLDLIDTTNFGAYISGGFAYPTWTEYASAVPTLTTPNIITWNPAVDALEYNIYREYNGTFGLIGITGGTTLNDIGQTPDITHTPPRAIYRFSGVDNYPASVTYIQQRLVFANTINAPEKVFLSKIGDFKNFTNRSPIQEDDSFNFVMAGSQVNEVKGLVDLGRLVVLTTGGEWSASGGDGSALTPSTIALKQYSYNGSGDLNPIIIDGAAIYQQARGSIIRDLGYDFQIDGYSGNDLTIFSAHLFDKFTLIDWAFQQIPQSILWVVRSDGSLLGMTFVRNQQVRAWHIHDLGGVVENVAVVPEGNEDILYVVVRRVIDGNSVRYVERLDTRQITNIVESKFLDSSITYDGRNLDTGLTMTLSGGTTWAYDEEITLTSSAGYFVMEDVGKGIHLETASGEIVRTVIQSWTSITQVQVKPNKTVPVALRSVATNIWDKAISYVDGLWNMEGEDVSVFADGFVVASPNNASYEIKTVTNGAITLSDPYSVIHVGLPYLSDIETLDVDTSSGETISDKNKIIGSVACFFEDTRGVWTGAKPPTDDSIDPLENLIEYKIRATEDYDSPVNLVTDVVEVNIKPEWNTNGRVFLRQVDPIPMSILSVNPAGKFPF